MISLVKNENLNYQLSLTDHNVYAFGDRGRLQLVLFNLLQIVTDRASLDCPEAVQVEYWCMPSMECNLRKIFLNVMMRGTKRQPHRQEASIFDESEQKTFDETASQTLQQSQISSFGAKKGEVKSLSLFMDL